jgi:ribosomal protein S12 methylthiotransferase accessory factor
MTVALVGSGPARDAVAAALGDVDAPVADVDPAGIVGADLTVVIGQAGDPAFETVDEIATEEGIPWLAVEIGGLAGIPVVEAAVSGFGPDTGCYHCLRQRVRANTAPNQEPQAAPDSDAARFAGAVAGREAVRLRAGTPTDVLGSVIELPYDQRRFLPVPDCRCAPDRDRTLVHSHVDRTLEESLSRAEQALDDRVGIVSEVGEAESFPVPYYLANLADTSGFSDATAARQAAGVAADWNAAFMKALGEGLERYSAGVYRTETFETGPATEIEDAVSPSAFVTHDDAYREPSESDDIAWIEGENLETGDQVSLPAEFVVFPPPEEQYRPAITSGLGLGNGGVQALLSGLYEVIERDALMLSWYSTFEPLELAVEDGTYETMAARARSEDLSVTALLLTQDIDVPVVAVAVQGETWPQLAFGSGAHLDPTRAARAGLAEALQNWLELRGMGRDDAADADGAIGEYADFPDRVRDFVDPDGAVPADSVGPDEVLTGPAHVDAVVDRLSDAGLDAYAVRTTTRDLDTLGFEAVRALAPAAQPLFFDDPYFGERAESVPDELGFEPRLDRSHHPFP